MIILAPHVTEKTAIAGSKEAPAYTFRVHKDTNAQEVAREITRIYKVKPVKVNMAKTAEKPVQVKGRWSLRGGFKKAVVYLKKGDKIDFA